MTGFLFDRKASATALINACRRGVSVRVIIDRAVVARPLRTLVTALNADNVRDRNRDGVADNDPRAGRCNRALPADHGGLRQRDQGIPLMTARETRQSLREPTGREVTWGKDGSYVLRCSGSCRGAPDANMHSKIYAMSNSGTANNVVMVSSSNLNAGGAKRGWNDLVVMKNRPKTFEFLVRLHRLMTAQRRAGPELLELTDGPYTTRIFPIAGGKDRDPLLRDLRKIKCSSAFGPTSLHIQQFWWNGHRGNYLWDKIRSLARARLQGQHHHRRRRPRPGEADAGRTARRPDRLLGQSHRHRRRRRGQHPHPHEVHRRPRDLRRQPALPRRVDRHRQLVERLAQPG